MSIKVKNIFFLTKSETNKVRQENKDSYILDNQPHYELEDGRVLYTRGGVVSEYTIETIVTEAQPDATTSKIN